MLKSEIRRKRETQIISVLNKLGIVDVDIIMRLNVSKLGDSTKRNALRVLNRMVDDGTVDCLRKEVKLFCVKGRGFGYWEHRLMMNKFIVNKGMYSRVKIEPKIKIDNELFRPDFMYPIVNEPKTQVDWRFYEVDRTQKIKVNHEKAERYKRLGLQFEVVCHEDRKHIWKGCVVNVVD